MYDMLMHKKVERLYIECGLDMNTIYKQFEGKIKRSALYLWKKKGDWTAKRINYLTGPKSQEERLSAKIDDTLVVLELTDESDKIIALTKYVVALKTIHAIETNSKSKMKTVDKQSKNLSKEAVREIEMKLFGFTEEDYKRTDELNKTSSAKSVIPTEQTVISEQVLAGKEDKSEEKVLPDASVLKEEQVSIRKLTPEESAFIDPLPVPEDFADSGLPASEYNYCKKLYEWCNRNSNHYNVFFATHMSSKESEKFKIFEKWLKNKESTQKNCEKI